MSKTSQSESSSAHSTDAFQATLARSLETVEKNRAVILAVLVLLVLAGAGYAGWESYASSQERKAAAALFAVEKDYLKIKEGFDKARFQSLMGDMAKAEDPAKKEEFKAATGDLQTDYGPVVTRFEEVMNQHPGRAAAAQAALYTADILSRYEQPDKAVAVLQKPAQSLSKDNLLYGLTNIMLGNVQASQGQCESAIQAWQNVMGSDAIKFLHADATLKMGVCYESLDQGEKAAEMYRKASTDFANTAAGQTAKNLLRLLEIKKKTPAAQAGA